LSIGQYCRRSALERRQRSACLSSQKSINWSRVKHNTFHDSLFILFVHLTPGARAPLEYF
jgi:hypothetical protein